MARRPGVMKPTVAVWLALATVAVTEAVAEAAGACALVDGCIANHPNLLRTANGLTVDQCCRACTGDYKCAAWTRYLPPGGSVPLCNLFATVVNGTPGLPNCTSGRTGEKAPRPNFVFSFPDTLRAESFSGYGIDLDVTPNLAKFAETGVRFEQAHVMHTQCSPSRCTMLTGRYMHVLGHRTQTHLVQDYENNYLRTLKDAGYHIQYAGKNDAFSATAFNLSVSNWSQTIGYPSGSNAFKPGEAGFFSFLSQGSNSSGADPSKCADYKGVVDALEWLNNDPPEPFVLFLPSRGAHPPYGAPLEWHNKFPVQEVKNAVKLRERNIAGMPTYMQNSNGIPHFRNLTSLDEDVFYKIQSVYLGMVAYTDWIFGQLVEGIDKAPDHLANRTVIFFSSDHGDFGGDYGLVEKWPGSMADVLTRVPLFARMPGGAKGHVSKAAVQTADIFETMLELASVNASWVRFANSLVPQLRGGEGDLSRYVYSEGGFYFENEQMMEAQECVSSCPDGLYCPRGQEEQLPNGSPRAAMIRNVSHKLVHRPTGVSELYDLVADPRETKNLFSDPGAAALRQGMLMDLLDWHILTGDVTPDSVDSRGAPRYPHPIPPANPYAQPLAGEGDAPVVPWAGEDIFAVNGISE